LLWSKLPDNNSDAGAGLGSRRQSILPN
jgi:hypothetical protein